MFHTALLLLLCCVVCGARYMLLAFVCGNFYGLAYRYSGHNLLAAVIVHSTTDTMWATAFK